MRRIPISIVVALTAFAAGEGRAAEAPVARPCPAAVGPEIACLHARDEAGAHVLIARPTRWNGKLIVHMHGGPRLAAPRADTSEEDLVRFIEVVREGYAWVASSRRRGGYGATMGAEDADRARRIYEGAFGRAERTYAHGQSWGGNVAAILIEKFNAPGSDGRRPYDGALITAGVLTGGTRAYRMRIDLRAAFQAICAAHPRPDEPAYHLGLGLPVDASMTRDDLRQRFDACTGADKPLAQRTDKQRRAAADLAAASRVPEANLYAHLSWATFVFQDIARHLTDGRPAFGNLGVVYRGTSDDAAFDARVPRVAADPEAVRLLAADSDPTGRIAVPVVTMHAIHDPTVFVEAQNHYRVTVDAAGAGHLLFQTFVDDRNHSKVGPPHYPALLRALDGWVATGVRPVIDKVVADCAELRATHPGECRFRPDFAPGPWDGRVNPRPGA
jgi:hypothetical protein